MKKYKAPFPLLFAACLLLTSCNGGAGDSETALDETLPLQFTLDVPPAVSEEMTAVPEITLSEEDADKITEKLPVKVFTAPDGRESSVDEAVSIDFNKENGTYTLTFDSGYMGFVQPIYCDTDEIPELYRRQFEDFNPKVPINDDSKVENQEYFGLKKGQKLENGLTVSDAYLKISMTEDDYEIEDNTVTLDGEITLNGVLYCKKKNAGEVASYDEILFYPNPEHSDDIPCPYFGDELTVFSLKDTKTDFAFVTSAFPFKLGTVGNISSAGADLTKHFSKADCIKAKVKISDIVIRFFNNTPACFGVLDEIEIVTK